MAKSKSDIPLGGAEQNMSREELAAVAKAVAALSPEDQSLLAAVQADLQERREIAVDVQVKAPAAVEMDVSAELAVREGTDFSAVKAAAEQALASFFSGRRLGGPVLLAELGDLLYHVEGVENYRLLAPAADLAAEDGTLPMLGRVTVTEMEADDDV